MGGSIKANKQVFSVLSYNTTTATLELGHAYPEDTNVKAMVDVELLLETINHEQTRIGEWLNVVGYVTPRRRGSKAPTESLSVHVQALIVWPTGPLDVQRYEKTFEYAE